MHRLNSRRTELRNGAGPADSKGLAAGTRVLTMDGLIPVEYLTPGERIITRNSGASILRGLRITRHVAVRPVTVAASALGHNQPDRDITLGPDQHILLRGWKARALYGVEAVRLPALRLVDGRHIVQADAPTTLCSFSLIFDAVQTIYADGVELAMMTVMAAPTN